MGDDCGFGDRMYSYRGNVGVEQMNWAFLDVLHDVGLVQLQRLAELALADAALVQRLDEGFDLLLRVVNPPTRAEVTLYNS